MSSSEKQSARVTGRLMCHGKPEQYAELKLLSSRLIGNNILSENVFTDPDGYFEISGFVDQFFRMDVRLWVWHGCFNDDKPRECKNWLEFNIPDQFVNKGPIPRNFLRMGTVDLDEEQKKERLDKCS